MFQLNLFLHPHRCLRKVSDSWNIFIEFSWSRKCRSRKRKKFSADDHNSMGELTLVSSCISGDNLPPDSKRKKAYGCHNEDYVTQMSPFECARNCLFQLKASIESLYQKNLFPYNPLVLLRRYVCLTHLGFSLVYIVFWRLHHTLILHNIFIISMSSFLIIGVLIISCKLLSVCLMFRLGSLDVLQSWVKRFLLWYLSFYLQSFHNYFSGIMHAFQEHSYHVQLVVSSCRTETGVQVHCTHNGLWSKFKRSLGSLMMLGFEISEVNVL